MHGMNADLSDLLHLLQNLIRLGTIAELKGGKARVQLEPKFTTKWLKLATRHAGSTRTWSMLTVGEQVIVSPLGCDLTRGIILLALYSQAFNAPKSSDSIHATYYPDGAVMQYDHTAHSLSTTLPGGTATITADKVTSNALSTIYRGDLIVMKNLIVKQSTTVEDATSLNGSVNAKAGAAVGGAITVQGTIKASDDVVAGAISLAKHPQGSTKPGGDQSGGSQPLSACTPPPGAARWAWTTCASRLPTFLPCRLDRASGAVAMAEVPELIEQPLNSATQLRIYAATAFALRSGEPRLQLASVQLTPDIDDTIALLLNGTSNGQGITMVVPWPR